MTRKDPYRQTRYERIVSQQVATLRYKEVSLDVYAGMDADGSSGFSNIYTLSGRWADIYKQFINFSANN